MKRLQELWRRLRYLGGRSRFSGELGDEIEFHIECRVQELMEEGFPPADAHARALREFGPSRRATDDTRDAWRIRWIEDLLSDVRYAARAFRRNPGFALTAIVCLALGIGANTTMFSITMALLFSRPTCRDVNAVIAIRCGGNSSQTLADYRFVRDAHIFQGVAGINPERELNWRDGDQTSRRAAALVTDDYFRTLDIPFLLGRGIAPGEMNTVVISERLWRSRFAADPGVLGLRMVLDGRAYTITGVLPADHRNVVGFGFSPDIYAPVIKPDDYVAFYARMPRGMTIPIARGRLLSVLRELDRIHPVKDWSRLQGTVVTSVSGTDWLAVQVPGIVMAFFAMLMTLVGLVLLIACTNVASLLLARASSRSQELAVRLSLGASRARIVRHLLAESLLLALLGAAAGLLINLICARLVSAITLPLPVPIHLVISPDARLLEYSLVIVLVTTLISGLLPALRAARRDINAALIAEQRQTSRTWGMRSFLVAGQLAASVVLLSAGFLFLHNLLSAVSLNPGFDVNHVLWAGMRLVPERYAQPAAASSMVNTALERLRALPGVEGVAITSHVPLNDNCKVGIDLRTAPGSRAMMLDYECDDAGPDYFRTMRIPLLAGREFTSADGPGSQHVAIVNQSFARAVFGSVNPIGRTIWLHDWPPTQIVGIVADSKYFSLGENHLPALYQPYVGQGQVGLQFMIRTAGPPAASVREVVRTLDALDSTAAIDVRPMSRALGFALLPSRAGAAMLGAMGVLGMALSAIGLYGVLLYSVSRRTREIGLRVALGATPGQVLRLVFRHSFALVGSGMALGLLLAFAATRPLAMFLVPGLSASDPAAFLAVIAVLGATAFLATMAPALRALHVDPMTALRYQ